MRSKIVILILALLLTSGASLADEPILNGEPPSANTKTFRAGAFAIDASPSTFPVMVNGGFLQNSAQRLNDQVRARSLVLDDGSIRLAIVVVDSCMMPRELLDKAKELTRQKTGIPPERILISATHTHSAPAAMGALGCPADANYVAILPAKIAEAIERATQLLEPARIGWHVINDDEHTFCRRWIRRPDKMLDDPFGQRTVRANMHPGYQNPDAIAPAGPIDPALTVLSVQAQSGRPIAVLANYSMHYYGANPISADYFGRFSTALAKRIGAEDLTPSFVGIMSQGTSGDQMWMDYGQPRNDPGLDAYADAVARFAQRAYQAINYRDWVPLAMAETTLTLGRRVPDGKRLAWARGVISRMGNRDIPQSLPEVYAKEATILHDEPRRELKLQAIRIGELGIAAIPNEVFAITGLKIKARSPFATTMNIELANGSEGYIPPPEQHALGGYTTWPARTAGLEIQAEPKIVAAVLKLLEQVAGQPQHPPASSHGLYAKAVLASKPWAFWRLDDFQGPVAVDSTGHTHDARFDGRVAFYLPGPDAIGLSASGSRNRAVYFASGRLKTTLVSTDDTYTIELWFWNGLPNNIRSVTGVLVAVGAESPSESLDMTLGIGGIQIAPGRLCFTGSGKSGKVAAGKVEITPMTWHHVALVRNGRRVVAYLDGNSEPEIEFDAGTRLFKGPACLSVGGWDDVDSGFDGKIDEVALYKRTLTADELSKHVRTAHGPR